MCLQSLYRRRHNDLKVLKTSALWRFSRLLLLPLREEERLPFQHQGDGNPVNNMGVDWVLISVECLNLILFYW